jgi:hypothetical protein
MREKDFLTQGSAFEHSRHLHASGPAGASFVHLGRKIKRIGKKIPRLEKILKFPASVTEAID